MISYNLLKDNKLPRDVWTFIHHGSITKRGYRHAFVLVINEKRTKNCVWKLIPCHL